MKKQEREREKGKAIERKGKQKFRKWHENQMEPKLASRYILRKSSCDIFLSFFLLKHIFNPCGWMS